MGGYIPRRKLIDEVSVQEMLEYRRQGLKNSEIAALLDVTPVTILRYIGRNDGKPAKTQTHHITPTTRPVLDADEYAACKAHIEAKKAGEPSPLAQQMYKDAQAAKPTLDEGGKLKIRNLVMELEGEAGTYRVDQEKKLVWLDKGEFRFEELEALCRDLQGLRKGVHA